MIPIGKLNSYNSGVCGKKKRVAAIKYFEDGDRVIKIIWLCICRVSHGARIHVMLDVRVFTVDNRT